jgi:tetratricopeptide (TPR) repeat protein
LDEYLKGRALWTRRTEEAVRAALAHFRVAVEAAPGFALGHTGIADAYIILAAYDWMEPRQALPLAVAAAEQAQALDPTAGEPHASRGDLAIHYDRDLALAARELDRALELSPGHATAHHWRGEASLYGGRPAEAVGFLRRAIELDPLATAAHAQLALAYETLGQLEEAERGYRRAHAISPGYSWPAGALVRIDLARGRTANALAAAERAVEADASATNLATVGVSLAWVGRTDEARAVLARLTELGRQRWISPYELARIEAALGERDTALAHLRDAVEASVFRVQALSAAPELEFRRFADDPEFERIRNEMWRRR